MPLASLLALLAVSSIWGLYYLATNELLESGWNPDWMNALRFLFGGGLLLLLLFLKGEKREVIQLQKSHYKEIILVAFIGIFVGMWLLTAGQERVSSSIAGTLSALIPLFVALLGTIAFFGKENLANRGWLGILLGFLGVVLIYNPIGSDIDIIGFLLVTISTFFLALEAQLIRKWFSSHNVLAVVALVVIWTGVFFLILAIPQEFQAGSWIILIALSIMSNIVAFLIYFWLIAKEGAIFANISSYLIPVIALFAGVILNSEPLTSGLLIGASACLIGALLIGEKRQSKENGDR